MDGSEAWEARLASRRRWRGWLVGGAVRLVLVAACIDAAQASPRIHSRGHDDGGGSRALLNERGHLANAALLTHPDPCAGSVINAQPDACAYVRTHCAVEPGESLVDYRVFVHCRAVSRAQAVAVMCLVVALAFWILGDTAEGYFCPAVRTLADRWNLAPATAGVTLLALGNGAPDVFASLAAFSKFSANDGFINASSPPGGGDSTGGNITLNASETSSGMVGAIVSAGMFVSGAVVGAVALVASPFRVDPGPFNRDVGFYLIGVAGVFLVVMDGRVHPWEAVLLPAYYVVFVVYVVASDVSADPAGKTHSRHKRRRELTIGGEFDPGSRVNNNEAGPEENGSTRAQKDSRVELRTMEDGYAAAPTGGERSVDGIDTSKTDARRRNFASSAPLAVSARAFDALTSRATRWFALRWKEANGSESSSDGSGSGSLRRGLAAVWIVCFIAPLEALRRCTIPNASAKKYNAFYATCNVCLSPLLLLHLARDVVVPLDRPVMYVPGSGSTGLTGSSVPVPAWGFTLLVSGCAAVLFWRRFHSFGGGLNDWTPPPWWDGSATLVVSFLCSVAWIAVAATELLGCLTAIGGAIGVSPAALSVSVLAWGNR